MASLVDSVRQGPVSAADDPDRLFEVIDGQRVEIAPMGALEGLVANVLSRELWSWPGMRQRGVVVVEVLFQFAEDLKLRPDLAFVPFDRWTESSVPEVEAWRIIPPLVVEVVSRSNTAHEVQRKVRLYFSWGVDLVWMIYPQQRQIYVYRGPKDVQILDADDELTAEPVLPGFRLPVRVLFEHVKPADEPADEAAAG